MIDFHSHILPGIDDGSKNTNESLLLLDMLRKQGITKVVATPHFCANRSSVNSFLEKRDDSLKSLLTLRLLPTPEIISGAEVKYYEGISRLDGINKLCIGNSNLLLLEMPMKRWTEYTVREIIELNSSRRLRVVLAHIERYLKFQDKDLIEELVSSGVLIQANADFFLSFVTRRKAVAMLKSRLIHFVGSDCHGIDYRPPKIGNAYSLIKHKAGSAFLSDMSDFADSCLI